MFNLTFLYIFSSPNWLIPQGGCCKICGGVTHLAKDCPNKGYRGSVAAAGAGYTCKF